MLCMDNENPECKFNIEWAMQNADRFYALKFDVSLYSCCRLIFHVKPWKEINFWHWIQFFPYRLPLTVHMVLHRHMWKIMNHIFLIQSFIPSFRWVEKCCLFAIGCFLKKHTKQAPIYIFFSCPIRHALFVKVLAQTLPDIRQNYKAEMVIKIFYVIDQTNWWHLKNQFNTKKYWRVNYIIKIVHPWRVQNLILIPGFLLAVQMRLSCN